MALTASRPPARPGTWRTRAAYWWISLSALAIAVLALGPYLGSSLPEMAADPTAIAATYVDRSLAVRAALYAHVFAAGLALVLSPLQFAARLRARAPWLHRGIGRIAIGSVTVAGCAALVLAPFTRAGPVGAAGFALLAVLWLSSAAAAFRAIRRGDVATHRRWAVRTFALTYAGVTLRLQLMALPPVVAALTGSGGQAAWDRTYLVAAFLSWIPNLLVAELYLAARRSTAPGRTPS